MVYPAQLRVMLLAPMTSPFPEQGPMLAVRVVLVVIVAPHDGFWAETEAGKKASVEPITVKRSRTARGIFGGFLRLKTEQFYVRTDYLQLRMVRVSLKRISESSVISGVCACHVLVIYAGP